MSHVLEIAEPLTADEAEQVKTFAEFLVQRRPRAAPVTPPPPPHQISFEGWAGCMAHVEPEKSNKQLMREAWDAVIDKLDRAGEREQA